MANEAEKMQGTLETFDQQEMVGICGRNDEFLRIIRVLRLHDCGAWQYADDEWRG